MTRWISSFALVAVTVSGCASLGHKSSGTPVVFETDMDRAVRCVCLWNTGEAESSDGRSSRGFAGQLYFFTVNEASPVAVAGDLRVFVFDDIGTDEEQSRPMHEFEVPAEALQGFVKDTQLGPAYNIFVPYPRRSRDAVNCTLRVRLTRPDGSRVFSEMAEVKLPGPEPAGSVVRSKARDLPLAEELPQQILARGETIGVRSNGTVSRASHDQFAQGRESSFDETRVSAYEQKINDFMRTREVPVQPQAEQVKRVSDRSEFESIPSIHHDDEPLPFIEDVPSTRELKPPASSDTFEIRTLSRPLSRVSSPTVIEQSAELIPVELPLPIDPSAALSAEEADAMVLLPEPDPFVPVGDQVSVEQTVADPFLGIDLPLPVSAGS